MVNNCKGFVNFSSRLCIFRAMKKLILLLLMVAPFSPAVAQSEPAAKVIEPVEFQKEMQREEVLLIDVRTPEEFEAGHLEKAVNIDFLSEDFLEKTADLDKSKPILIYCRSGNRSGKAAVLLRAEGFKDITDLKVGYKAWIQYFED